MIIIVGEWRPRARGQRRLDELTQKSIPADHFGLSTRYLHRHPCQRHLFSYLFSQRANDTKDSTIHLTRPATEIQSNQHTPGPG
jgi:hypothetical protein